MKNMVPLLKDDHYYLLVKDEEGFTEEEEECTLDGSVDCHGILASRVKTGGWPAAIPLLMNQSFATLAFYGVGVNLVLFLTRVMNQENAHAANNISVWFGTTYLFSLLAAFLSDSYWGRYKTCAIFQVIFVTGLISLLLSSYLFLVKPTGCGGELTHCQSHSTLQLTLFYLSIYLIALGNGGYQSTIQAFGADQFDERHPKETKSKVAFYSYFYVAFNFGSLFSDTILGYYEDMGLWVLGFSASSLCAIVGLVLFLLGAPRYRHFIPKSNPFSSFCQVIVAAYRKRKLDAVFLDEVLFEVHKGDGDDHGSRKINHTRGFKFLDKAATITIQDSGLEENASINDPWRLCTVTQVEQVKCILRLLPIWLCTIFYTVVFTQMSSIFVEQGNAMNTYLTPTFNIPPASMTVFNILSAAAFIFLNTHVLEPFVSRCKRSSVGLTVLQRMGIGLVLAMMALISGGIVEHFRLMNPTGVSILWQVPPYVMIGASEAFMYVGQLEFFCGQVPDTMKTFGSALSMLSMSLGNYLSSLIVTAVMKLTILNGSPGWIPENLNEGHLDRFYYLLAALTLVDFLVYVVCAWSYNTRCIRK